MATYLMVPSTACVGGAFGSVSRFSFVLTRLWASRPNRTSLPPVSCPPVGGASPCLHYYSVVRTLVVAKPVRGSPPRFPRSPVPPRVLNCPGHQVAWTIKYVVRLVWGGGWTHRIISSLVYLCKARTCSSGLAHCRGLRRARPRFRTLGSASSFQRKLHLTVCVLLPLPSPPLPSFSARPAGGSGRTHCGIVVAPHACAWRLLHERVHPEGHAIPQGHLKCSQMTAIRAGRRRAPYPFDHIRAWLYRKP